MLDGFPEDLRIGYMPSVLSDAIRAEWEIKGGEASQLVEVTAQDLQAMTDHELTQFTHIIANEPFEGMDRVAYRLYIPVVQQEWLEEGFKAGKVQPVKMFTPDARMVLRGDNICLGKMDSGEVLKVLVNKFGGEVHSELKTNINRYIKGSEMDANLGIIRDFNERGSKKIDIVDLAYVMDKIEPQMALDGLAVAIHDSIKGPVRGILKKFVGKMASSVVKMERADVIITTVQLEGVENQRTPDWLFDHALGLTRPSILHIPRRLGSARGMEGVVVATTNYTGDSRRYIEQLVEMMGGTFAKTLKKGHTTHLVAANSVGDKWTYATAWGVEIINHCWVEDTFLAWQVQDCAKYSALVRAPGTNVRIIDTCAPEQELKKRVVQSSEESEHEMSSQHEAEPIPPAKRAKKAKKSKEIPKKADVDDIAGNAPTVASSPPAMLNITAILTGVETTLSPKDKKHLKAMGITIIDNPMSPKLNSIISPTLLRTEKFLKGMSKDPEHYLCEQVLTDALNGNLKDISQYSLWDKIDLEEVKTRGIFQTNTLEEAKDLMANSKDHMLAAWEFVCTNETMSGVIKAYGGRAVKRSKSKQIFPIKWDEIVLSLFAGTFPGEPGRTYQVN